MRTVSFLSLQTCPNCAQPIFVRFFFVRHHMRPCDAMEIKHRAHDGSHVAHDVDKQSTWKQFAQTTNMEGVLWRLIYPARLVFRVRSRCSYRINEFRVKCFIGNFVLPNRCTCSSIEFTSRFAKVKSPLL